jgi:hypothetical protein
MSRSRNKANLTGLLLKPNAVMMMMIMTMIIIIIYLRRLRLILVTELSAKNKIQAVGSLAIPVLR